MKSGISIPSLNGKELYIKAKQDTLIFSRGWDIPILINYDIADFGVTGIDVVTELTPEVDICEYWPIRKSRVVIAEYKYKSDLSDSTKIIATEYPRLTKEYLKLRSIQAKLIPIRGAAESVGGLENLWKIVTLVTSGETLRKNNLIELETLMETNVCLISNHKMKNSRDLFWSSIKAFTDQSAAMRLEASIEVL